MICRYSFFYLNSTIFSPVFQLIANWQVRRSYSLKTVQSFSAEILGFGTVAIENWFVAVVGR